MVTDKNANILEINQTLKALLKFQNEDNKQSTLYDLFTIDLAIAFMHDNQELAIGEVIKNDYAINGKNKNIRFLSIDSLKLNENTFLSFVKDITQRKELEKTLSEKKILLEKQNEEIKNQNIELLKANAVAIEAMMLYDLSPSGYFTINKQGKIIRLNLSSAKILNYKQNELKNNVLFKFLSEESVGRFQNFIDELYKSDNHINCEIEILSYDKKRKYVHLEGIKSKTDNLALISAVDITNLKNLKKL